MQNAALLALILAITMAVSKEKPAQVTKIENAVNLFAR
jgi:hypothetical protein